MSVFNYKGKKLNVLIAAKWGFCQKNNVLLYKVAAFQTGTDLLDQKCNYLNGQNFLQKLAITHGAICRCDISLQRVAATCCLV